jgi:SAM-dependent methyltransferase
MTSPAHRDLATADGHDRHVPSGTRDILAAGHEGVYQWAADHLVVEGTRFLDVGCGTGYGSTFVTAAGGTYDGTDGSPAAIEFARIHYAREGVRFFVADVMDALPAALEPRSYDVVFSSEVLEHVSDPFAMVDVMAGCMTDAGVCFVGTPNRLWSAAHMPGKGLLARSHVMEFTPPALVALLGRAFEEVTLLYRMLPVEAIGAIAGPTSRPPVVRGALAFAREVIPDRYREAVDRRKPGRQWSPEDIEWVEPGDPRRDPDRCVGLVATCRRPRRT